MTSFVFQQPGSAKLLEAMDAAADGADCGAGVFAFASTGGIEALFSVPALAKMLARRKPFHLIVGVDAITNAEALLCIADKQAQHRQALTAEVFFHKHPASTFHPKFAWFLKGQKLHLITGSGNLTLRGLGQVSAARPAPGNWEAFSVQVLAGEVAQSAKRAIDSWLNTQRAAKALRSLGDEMVKSQAMANGLVRYVAGPVRPRGRAAATAAAPRAVPVDDIGFQAQDILVRELSSNRHGQADVRKDALSDFFGYSGKKKDVLVQHVSLADQLGPAKKIPLFVNKSRNYRLELNAIADFSYDVAADDSRMILVATKLDRRSFRYTIVPVTSPDHVSLVALLGPMKRGRRLMREKRVTGDELRQAWAGAPDNLLPMAATTPPP